MEGKLFQYEDGSPMRFFILSGSLSKLRNTIKKLGGEISGPFHAHFALVDGKEAKKEIGKHSAQLVDGQWVVESITANKIQPTYSYLYDTPLNSGKDGVPDFGESERDLAEFIKAAMYKCANGGAPDPAMYEMLHKKYPHLASQQWQALYDSNKPKIDMTIVVFKADLEKTINDRITFLLRGQIGQVEEDTRMMGGEGTVFTMEDEIEIGEDNVAPREDAIPTRTDGNANDNQEMMGLSVSSANGGAANMNDNSAGLKLDTKPKIIHQYVPGVSKVLKRSRYTKAERDAMARFLIERGLLRNPSNANRSAWRSFYEQNSSVMKNRTLEGLCQYFANHKDDLIARAQNLSKAKPVQPGTAKQGVNVAERDDQGKTGVLSMA